jgi:hypothetical protein
MQYKEKYISPYRTVQLIEQQAGSPENVLFAAQNFGGLNNGSQIWNKVKPLVTFKRDPPTVDTIQGIVTFFDPAKNIHRLPGAGDCDCYTSVLASICKANGLPYEYIMQGNGKPSHIAISINGFICDLTNNKPNYLRHYQKTQNIKPMYVQLSDDSQAYEVTDFAGPKFDKFLKGIAKPLLPVVSGAANLVVPGSGTAINIAGQKALDIAASKDAAAAERQRQQLEQEARDRAAAASMQPARAPGMPSSGNKIFGSVMNQKQNITEQLKQAAAAGKITPGAVVPRSLPVAPMPVSSRQAQQAETPTLPGTYVLPAVPITAPKINPLFIVGGLALAYFLFTKKK